MSAGDPAELDTDALPSFPDPGVLLAAVGLPSRAIREVLGVERIAAQWADRNGVHQIVCKPDWDRHGRAAPFRRNDELLNLQPETPEQRIVQALADAETPLSQRQIRERAATRATTVAKTLQTLIRERRVERAPGGGYRLAGAGKESTVTAVDGKNPRDPFPETVSGSNP